MSSPRIGRSTAVALILAFFGWHLVRSLGARPPAEPTYPFPKPSVDAPLAATKSKETAVLAGGCFWGMQAVFEHVKGVQSVTAGYAGGRLNTPSYEAVSTGRTGHAESVSVVFDSSKISYGQILMIFFSVAHDPTQVDRQGPDDGTQYRSAIFYSSEGQKRIAVAYVEQLDGARVYPRKIVTEITPFKTFFRAEEYHQDYLQTHTTEPYIMYNDLPKLENLKKRFPELYHN